MSENIKSYIKKNKPLIREYQIGETAFVIKSGLTGDIDITNILHILKNLPSTVVQSVDAIYIGEFPFLKKRQVDALFDERTIYVSNEQTSEQELLKNIIHEFAHGCEELYYSDIYEDGNIKQEFINKRSRMYDILSAYGFNQLPKESYLNPEYDEQFDQFLYKTIGYSKLGTLCRGIFLSPYASTSLREYFANGFEKYFLGDKEQVKIISPLLYEKIGLFSNKPV